MDTVMALAGVLPLGIWSAAIIVLGAIVLLAIVAVVVRSHQFGLGALGLAALGAILLTHPMLVTATVDRGGIRLEFRDSIAVIESTNEQLAELNAIVLELAEEQQAILSQLASLTPEAAPAPARIDALRSRSEAVSAELSSNTEALNEIQREIDRRSRPVLVRPSTP